MSSNSKPRSSKSSTESLWTWQALKANGPRRKKGEKNSPVAEFIRDTQSKLQEMLLGPGAGVGVGCGAGFGVGLVGGVGVGGWGLNEVKAVVGFGLGCGVGVGVGYGKGIGYAVGMEPFKSSLSGKRSDSDKRIIHL